MSFRISRCESENRILAQGLVYLRGASAEKCGRRFVYMIFLDSNHPTKLMSEHILLYTRLDNA